MLKNGTSRPILREVLLAERAGFEPANLVGYTLSKRAR